MRNLSTKKIALNGLLIAIVFLATYLLKLPGIIPMGYVTLGDTAIILAALLFGRNSGLLAGAIGSCLSDLAAGYFIYAPITLVVKGLEGFVIGLIGSKAETNAKGSFFRIAAVIAGELIMVAGYFVAETALLKYIDKSFGLAVAVSDLPFNFAQAGISAVLGYAVTVLLLRMNVGKITRR